MNINKCRFPSWISWNKPEEMITGPGMALMWVLPSADCGRNSMKGANVITLRWQWQNNLPSAHESWIWFGSVAVPQKYEPVERATYWRHFPLVLQLQYVKEVIRVKPINDSRGIPLVVLIDRNGRVVPWIQFERMTTVQVLFLTQTLSELGFEDLHAVPALYFHQGRCRAPQKDQALYRKRLARICAAKPSA